MTNVQTDLSDKAPSSHNGEDTVAETETSETTAPEMKLVVRSPYWGRILKGKTRRNYDSPGKSYRVIACQVVHSIEGQYWGCCPHHGKRVLELKEEHFMDHYSHDWDLYMVGTSVAANYMVHAFFLLPNHQNAIDVPHKMSAQGWTKIGTASAAVMRLDLEGMLQGYLKENTALGYRFHHVHVEILMDQIFDRETPRTRKATSEKSANKSIPLRNKNLPGDHVRAPPIPHVVSNDASWNTDTTHSSSANSMGPENWSEYPLQPSCYPTEHVQWYPASVPHVMPPPPAPPVVAPVNHLLHHSYPYCIVPLPSQFQTVYPPYHYHDGSNPMLSQWEQASAADIESFAETSVSEEHQT